MATIKSFTSIEQSRKLADILPIESADMCYPLPCEEGDKPLLEQGGFGSTPCWSLAALLDTLKYPSLTQNVENKWFITDWTGAYPKGEYGFDNAVDACVVMIEKLHELKML